MVSVQPYHPINNYKHPGFAEQSERNKSFETWPKANIQHAKLVNCGFFYTGSGDKVCCYSCGIEIDNWEADDDPEYKHIILSECCIHLEDRILPGRLDFLKKISYRNFEIRLFTFIAMSSRYENPEELARNGLFYRGPSSGVQCYSCGHAQEILGSVNPVTNHLKQSPYCDHLQQIVHLEVLMVLKVLPTRRQDFGVNGIQSDDIDYSLCQYSMYKDRINRLMTYREWNKNLSPIELATVGFFYTGKGDTVVCFFCGVIARVAVEYNDPRHVHASLNPECQYLKRNTPEYLFEQMDLTRRYAQYYYDDDPQTFAVSSRLRLRYPSDIGPIQKLSEHPIYSAAPQYLIQQMGFPQGDVKTIIEECMEKEYAMNADFLANVLLDKQERRGIQNRPALTLKQPNLEKSSRKPDSFKCRWCRESNTKALFIPCRHIVLCRDCAAYVKRCPVCRHEVQSVKLIKC